MSVNFTPFLPGPSNNLPLKLIFLDEWALVTVSGVDTVKYLQGQLTCDVTKLTTFNHCFAANCDANGKMLSNMCVFHYPNNKGLAFIERRSVRDSQLIELKKYARFSHTEIMVDDQAVLLGVAGLSAKTVLKSFFYTLPDINQSVISYNDTLILYFSLPIERYLFITNEATSYMLVQKLKSQAILNNSKQWLALDIEAGYPLIDSATSGKLFPQAVNLQALGGISFNKGCYVGQEMVARAQYRGANKLAMYWLEGKANVLPVVGEKLERKCGDYWRCTGMVLASCNLNNGNVWVQAVLNKKLVVNNNKKLQLRVQNDSASALIIRSNISN